MAAVASAPENPQTLSQRFSLFRQDLLESYDRRERIIKISRDITIKSKRLIFSLHRIASINDNAPDDPNDKNGESGSGGKGPTREEIFREAKERTDEIMKLWEVISKELEAEGKGSGWRYAGCFRPGMQEFIESQLFLHHLLSSPSTTTASLPQPSSSSSSPSSFPPAAIPPLPQALILTTNDYLEGLADCTGEMMRLVVSGWIADAPAETGGHGESGAGGGDDREREGGGERGGGGGRGGGGDRKRRGGFQGGFQGGGGRGGKRQKTDAGRPPPAQGQEQQQQQASQGQQQQSDPQSQSQPQAQQQSEPQIDFEKTFLDFSGGGMKMREDQERRAKKNFEVGVMVRGIVSDMELLDGVSEWTKKKITMIKGNLKKIEDASYTLSVRSAEDIQPFSSYDDNDQQRIGQDGDERMDWEEMPR